MKLVALTTFAALALAPAAYAFTGTQQLLSPVDMAAIRTIDPDANLSNLTQDQAAALAAALYGSDRQSEIGQRVRAILNALQAEASRAAGTFDADYIVNANSKGDRT